MPVVVCVFCDGKQFKNQEAYEQHARDNKKHKEKARSQTAVAPNVATTSQASIGSPGYCKTCKVDCGTAAGLQDHFNGGEYRHHPKCLRCNRGFESHASLDEHRKVTHPVQYCALCQKWVYAEDWAKHVAETEKHRASSPGVKIVQQCPLCKTPCDSEDEMKKHLTADHPELCCYTCGLTFLNTGDLTQHYQGSSSHPKCAICGLGFRDSLQCSFHIAEAHGSPSPQSQVSLSEVANAQVGLSRRDSSTYCSVCDRDYINAAVFEQHFNDHHSVAQASSHVHANDVPSSDALAPNATPQRPRDTHFTEELETFVTNESSSLSVQLQPDEEKYSDTSIGSIVEVHSTPRLLRVSSAPPSSVFDAQMGDASRQSDCIGTPFQDWTKVRASASGAASTRSASPTVPSQVLHSESASPSPVLLTQPQTEDTVSPVSSASATNSATSYHSISRVASPNPPTSRLSIYTAYRHITGNSPAPESSSGLASPVSAKSLLFTLSRGVARRTGSVSSHASPVQSRRLSCGSSLASDSSSGPATPASAQSILVADLQSGPPSTSRPASRRSSHMHEDTARSRKAPRKPSDRKNTADTETRDSTAPSTASATRIGGPNRSHSPAHTSPNAEPAKDTSSRWLCRTCFGSPSEPTVTMCGHLFCRSCIMTEIAKNLQCPVCKTVMLVRLHVD